MELLLINSEKLKITLTSKDLEEYCLTCDEIDYENTQTRRAIWTILDSAKKETGFDAAKNKVTIRVYPKNGGGCEMYISKRKSNDHFCDTERLIKEQKKDDPLILAFSFNSFEDLMSAIGAVHGTYGALFSSFDNFTVYKDIRSNYIITVDVQDSDEKTLSAYKAFSEFGEEMEGDSVACLPENCRCICKNDALERLAALL